MNRCVLDHLVITAPTLEEGENLVKKTLGVTLQKGGEHPRMGTHNSLLRLGDSIYLEVISVNPSLEKPNRPRWFALDNLTENTPAKLQTWVIRTDNICLSTRHCSEPVGDVEPMSRGDKSWLITIPENGSLPINEGAPALIEWKTDNHPAAQLIDAGLSLVELQIHNPEAKRIEKFLESVNFVGDVRMIQSNEAKMIALIKTPDGIRKLSS